MTRRLVTATVMLAAGMAVNAEGAQDGSSDLPALAASLDLSETGIRRWLQQLGVTGSSTPRERLLVVSPMGERLLERYGGSGSILVDAEVETLLARSDRPLVLIHNHPGNAGLSSADLRVLSRPAVVAIAAIGHDGSVFLASAGRGRSAGRLQEQYALAEAEVRKRLRAGWSASRVAVEVRDAHFSHLVALTLARAGVVRYWFVLSGMAKESYQRARLVFSWVVVGAADRLKNQEMRSDLQRGSAARMHASMIARSAARSTTAGS